MPIYDILNYLGMKRGRFGLLWSNFLVLDVNDFGNDGEEEDE